MQAWVKYTGVTIVFYLLAVMQASFFLHFNILGTVPNLVFIFYILILFFQNKKEFFPVIVYSIIAGLLLDIYMDMSLGANVISLILIGLGAKKIRKSLQEYGDKYPVFYFLPIFLVSFMIYEISLAIYFLAMPDWRIIIEIIYNLFFAAIGFLIFKRVQKIQG